MDRAVERTLYALGLSANYVGFSQLAAALEIALREPEALRRVTKYLYPETARRCGTNWKAVERNIRTMLRRAWRCAPGRLEEWAGCPLAGCPHPAQFIAILIHHLGDMP